MEQAVRRRAFFGRDAELAVFERALADAEHGAPSVLLVSGDAGMGKTTLVEEASDRAGVPLLLGRCMHIGGHGLPLAPLLDLVRRARRLAPDAAGLDALTSLLGGAQADASPAAVFEAALDLIVSLGNDGVVVVGFEDLHWADALTWDLVDFLVRNLVEEHVVLVNTYRHHDIGDAGLRVRLAELGRVGNVIRIDLDGLASDDVARHVVDLAGNAVSPQLVEDVIARGQGNPLFTEELIAARAAGEGVPSLLADLFAAELDQLDDEVRTVSAVVATVGRDTSHELLAHVLDWDEERIEHSLRQALDASLLVLDSAGEHYRFRHPLIGEVVASTLLPPERRRLHRSIGAAVAADPALAMSPVSRPGEIAFHLDKAGDAEGAFPASLEAVDVLAPVAPAAALAHLERALALWDQAGPVNGDRGTRTWQAAELAYATGDGERAVELARVATGLGEPPHGEAWSQERLARYLWTAGRLGESAEAYERTAMLLDGESSDIDRAAVYAGLAQADLLFCRFEEAERWSREALDLVPDPAAQPVIWLHATRILGVVCSHRGHTDEAVDLCRAAVSRAELADDHALATIYEVEALLRAARYEEAVTAALDGAAAGQRAGFDRSMGGYLSAMAVEALTHLGRWDEAQLLLDRLAGVDAVPVTRIRLALAGAALASRTGDHGRARTLVDAAASTPSDPWHEAFVLAGQADAAVHAGDIASALAIVGTAMDSACTRDARWPARFALLAAAAYVEDVLDARARREPLDENAIIDDIRSRIDGARSASAPSPNGTPPIDAHRPPKPCRGRTDDAHGAGPGCVEPSRRGVATGRRSVGHCGRLSPRSRSCGRMRRCEPGGRPASCRPHRGDRARRRTARGGGRGGRHPEPHPGRCAAPAGARRCQHHAARVDVA